MMPSAYAISTIPAGDAKTFAHLLNFDSVHGRWKFNAEEGNEAITIDETEIPLPRTVQ